MTTLPNGLFYGCEKLKEIDIPSSVATLYEDVFNGCGNLKSIKCNWTDLSKVKCDGEKIFYNVPTDAVLTVPQGTRSEYQATTPWSSFKTIVETASDDEDEEEEDDVEITDLTKYTDAIYFGKAEGQSGTSMTLSLRMKNKMKVSGLQANLYMPKGVKIAKVQRGDDLKTADEDEEYVYTFGTSRKDDGSLFLLSYSAMNTPMSSGEREIAKVTVEIDEDVKPGDYPLIVKNIEMSYGSENVKVNMIQTSLRISDYVLGDANGDGSVSVTDITSIAAYLMNNSKEINKNAADANKDGYISVTDITQIGKMLFGSAARSMTHDYAVQQAGEKVNVVLEDGEVEAGSEVILPICLSGSASAFQFDVYTPQGISIKKIQRGSLLKAMDDNDEYIFTLQSSPMDGGAFHRVVAYNTTDTPTAEAGEVVKLVLEVDECLSAGEYDIQLKETECGLSGVVLSTYQEYTAKLNVYGTSGINDVTTQNFHGEARIYNTAGVLVKQLVCRENDNQSVLLEGLPKGIYIIKCNDITRKVTKE